MKVELYSKFAYPKITGFLLAFIEQICYLHDGKSLFKLFDNINLQSVTYDVYLEQILEKYIDGIPKLWLLIDEKKEVQGFSLGYIPTKKTAYIPKHVDYGTDFYIASFFILPRFQRKGGGKLLLKKIVDFCYKNKIKKLFLNVDKNNKKAITFYNKMGFRITKEITNEYFMHKLIYTNLSNP